MKRVLWLILVLLALPIDLSTAAPNSQKTESLDIPQALEPWVPWVYSRHPEWACAKEGEEYTDKKICSKYNQPINEQAFYWCALFYCFVL